MQEISLCWWYAKVLQRAPFDALPRSPVKNTTRKTCYDIFFASLEGVMTIRPMVLSSQCPFPKMGPQFLAGDL